MMKAPESLTGMNVRKRIKEATEKVTEKAKDSMKIHKHHTGRQAYESSRGGSSVTSDDKDTSRHSSTATVKMATISTGSSNALKVETEATSKTTTTTKETFVEIHKDKSDFIGFGITSLGLVPVLGMMLSKDENGISLSSSVSIPVLLYGILMGLLAGVFLGRASKEALVSSTSVVHATEEPSENGVEPELVSERQTSREATRATKKSPRALSPFQPMKEAATKFKGNMKQFFHESTVKPWTSLSNFKDGQSPGTHPLWQHPSRSDPFKSSVGPGSALTEQMKNMGIRFRKKRTQPQATTPGASVQLPAKKGVEGETPEEPFEEDSSKKFGQIAAKQEDAETLEDVVEPAMKLRGVDVFHADPETGEGYSNLASHPYLVENGLRDVPTLLVNCLTGHGNVIQYLELPSYVTQLHDLVEEDTDDERTKAIKRFVNGDDDYRNERFKVLPSVATAPFAIRVIAPAKKEIIINSTYVKCFWRKHEAKTDPLTGKQLHPLLEVEIDCMSDKWVRSIVNLCIKNMSCIVVDVALLIQLRLDLQEDPKYDMANECQACIGMFRLDRVDMSECPTLPSRGDMSSFSEDELRASKIVGMDLDQLRVLRERAVET